MKKKNLFILLFTIKRKETAVHHLMAVLLAIIVMSCSDSSKEEEKLFEELRPEKTGITFSNTVLQQGENNVMNYPYYFNGGGVAVGDINNDGLIDIYFSGNQVSNKLYLNKGNFTFEDITNTAGVTAAVGWKTGVTMADVNQDGWLDIYVSRSAMGDSVLRKNLLYINNGNQTFTERADEYGVADNSYSTQAAFFDYDKDGDLDLFVLNHSLPKYGGFNRLLGNLKNQKSTKFGSKLYQNNNGKYHDVSERSGIISNVLSFGLGIAVSDLNEDGWPDLYISNDFNEEDYLYLNNQDGTFKNVIKDATGHVSLFSMGSDVADINNDALPDIITLDMMPETNERIKLSSGDDNYDKYQLLMDAGFHHQTMRNMLQLNNGDGTFSEIGQLAGISNTDWSWSALFADVDGDSWKDLWVTNGYEKDYTNMQFLKFTVDEQLKAQQTGAPLDMKLILDKMPAIETGNYLFKNNGDLTFTKKSDTWGISRKYKANGAAYADLDNDGDLDMVINTMNAPAVLYKNSSIENSGSVFLSIDLKKQNPKRIIAGTKVFVYTGDTVQYNEFSPVRGFQSSMYIPLTVGMNKHRKADSIRIVWPDNKTHVYRSVTAKNIFEPRYEEATALYRYGRLAKPLFSEEALLDWRHYPAAGNDFKRQFMLPAMYSRTGPKLATADVNTDGLVDVYVCGPRGQAGALFFQKPNGDFKFKDCSSFEADKNFQDEDASFFDADGDGDPDLYVVSGGYSFEANDSMLQDRLYINDGRGNFTKTDDAIPEEALAGSCVASIDIDGDHDLDLFVGSRLVPGNYPSVPQSMVLINDGAGHFIDRTTDVAAGLQTIGMVCDAKVADVNNDSAPDLILAGEWMSVTIIINQHGKLVNQSNLWMPEATHGWWNCLLAEDFDGDGDIDVMAGNYGLNTQFKVSTDHPATLLYKDFNGDGQQDPFFCYYIGEKSYPFASRDEALGQVSFLKPRYPDYVAYSNATIGSIFKPEELKDANYLHAQVLKTLYFENTGSKFVIHDLPVQAQFSPIHAMAAYDIDGDGDKDVVLAGNETDVRVRIGKSDANEGLVLLNNGKGSFSFLPAHQSGLNIKGDVRGLRFIPTNKGTYLICGVKGGAIKSYRIN